MQNKQADGLAGAAKAFDEVDRVQLMNHSQHRNDVKDWLLRFADCVRGQRFTEAKAMFCSNVVGFGTRVRRVGTADDLCDGQWRRVWPNTRDFEFDFEELDFYRDEHMAHVAVTWSSIARQFAVKRRRSGRASLLLIGNALGELKCAASHFSLDP